VLASSPSVEQEEGEEDDEKEKKQSEKKKEEKPKPEPKVKTVIVQVTSPNQKDAGSLLAHSTIGKDLAALLEKADSGALQRGSLPSISDANRKLLADSYGYVASISVSGSSV
jgi:hypothetical protein